MKMKKLLSVIMDIQNGMTEGDYKPPENEDEYNRNIKCILDLIEHYEQLLMNMGITRPLEKPEEKRILKLMIQDQDGNGMAAEIRCFRIPEYMDMKNFSYITGEMNFIRTYSNADGICVIQLPMGRYRIEVSKGSCYCLAIEDICINHDRQADLSISLKRFADLPGEGWFAGDLHHHSIYSSKLHGGTDPVTETPREVRDSMLAMGLDFGALSDHHNIKNHSEWSALRTEKFLPILSKEISTTNGHVLSLGVDKDIIYRTPSESERSDSYLRGEFIRITDEINTLGGLPQLNHPRDHQKAISWNPHYVDMIGIFQTLEVWNGSTPMLNGTTNWEAFMLWRELLENGRYIPATTGSDTHNIRCDDYHDYIKNLYWLANAIKGNMEVFSSEDKNKADNLLTLIEKAMPVVEKWAKRNLTSGGVRTYAYTGGTLTTEAVLNALRKGKSFLTNGPVLIPRIQGAIPGETILKSGNTVDISLQIYANRPLNTLTIHRNGGKEERIVLESVSMDANGKYTYDRIIRGACVKDTAWMFFTAAEDCTNMAITNPIFFKSLYKSSLV